MSEYKGRYVATATGQITAEMVKVRDISYLGTTNADDLIITDGKNVNKIWETKLGTVGTTGYRDSIDFGEGIWFDGLYVNTIDSGTVIIYFA